MQEVARCAEEEALPISSASSSKVFPLSGVSLGVASELSGFYGMFALCLWVSVDWWQPTVETVTLRKESQEENPMAGT